MGDRCYSRVYCYSSDVATFEDMGYHRDEEPQENECASDAVAMVDEEANYGNYADLCDLNTTVFIANNQSGGEYGPCEIVCDGKTVSDWVTDHDGSATLSVRDDGSFDPKEAEKVRQHVILYHKVRGMLGLDKRGKQTAPEMASSAFPDTLREWMSKIDPELFRKQRRLLVSLADRLAKEKRLTAAGIKEEELVDGLINLTDGMADYIADKLGRKEVLLTASRRRKK